MTNPYARRVEEIKRETTREERDALDDLPNVTGHGFGFVEVDGQRTGEVGIVCDVAAKVPESDLGDDDILPTELHGYRVDVVDPEPTPDSTRSDVHRPVVGGIRCDAPNVTGCTLGGPRFVDPDGDIVALTNSHCVDHTTGADVFQPNTLGGEDDKIGVSKDVHGSTVTDYATILYDEGIESFANTFAIDAMGPKESPVLGEVYINNGITHGYQAGVCTRVGEDADDWYDRPSETDWGGHSGSLWGRLDDDGIFYPTSLHWGSGGGDVRALAVSWEQIEDELDGELDVDVGTHGQPDPVGATEDADYETVVYDAEIDGRECHLKLVSCNTGGEGDGHPPGETVIRVQSADDDQPDDDEFIDEFTHHNDLQEYSLHEATIPRVNAYRRITIESSLEGDSGSTHGSDMLVEEAPSSSYIGFTRAAFDADEYHPEGTVGVEYHIKNGGGLSNDTNVNLLIDESVVDTANTGTLSQGEFDEGALEWPVDSGDIGVHDAEIECDEETIDLGTVEVQPLTITAEVHDGGTPIQDADVYIVDTTDSEAFEVVDVYQTDVNGEIDEDFDSGEYHALVDEDGFNALSRGFIDVSTHVEFALESYTAPEADDVNFDFELIPEPRVSTFEAAAESVATFDAIHGRVSEFQAEAESEAAFDAVRARESTFEAAATSAATFDAVREKVSEFQAAAESQATFDAVIQEPGETVSTFNAEAESEATFDGRRERVATLQAVAESEATFDAVRARDAEFQAVAQSAATFDAEIVDPSARIPIVSNPAAAVFESDNPADIETDVTGD